MNQKTHRWWKWKVVQVAAEPEMEATPEEAAIKAVLSLIWLGRAVILLVGVLPVLGLFPPLSLIGGGVFLSLWGHPIGQWFSIAMLAVYIGFVIVFRRAVVVRRGEVVFLAIIALALGGMMLWVALA